MDNSFAVGELIVRDLSGSSIIGPNYISVEDNIQNVFSVIFGNETTINVSTIVLNSNLSVNGILRMANNLLNVSNASINNFKSMID